MVTGKTGTAARAKRRQLREKAATPEGAAPIDRAAVFDRDNGYCYVCKLKVAWELMTLDHVVPLAKGGAHTEDNLRVAHRACNSEKGTDDAEAPRKPGLRRTRRLETVRRRAS
ncbi:MAG TPA: HNH endonuclease signature motif containing protein [Polyangiaceae bacterium]|jgi:5-methylcytosine-specific restriction endonuclease McrA